jgi:hypothetical protein
MELGPFTIADVEDVKAVFDSKNVLFEMFIDEDTEAEILKDFNERATSAPRAMAGKLELKIVFFEIADEDFEKVRHGLERFGVTVQSDGSYELGED